MNALPRNLKQRLGWDVASKSGRRTRAISRPTLEPLETRTLLSLDVIEEESGSQPQLLPESDAYSISGSIFHESDVDAYSFNAVSGQPIAITASAVGTEFYSTGFPFVSVGGVAYATDPLTGIGVNAEDDDLQPSTAISSATVSSGEATGTFSVSGSVGLDGANATTTTRAQALVGSAAQARSAAQLGISLTNRSVSDPTLLRLPVTLHASHTIRTIHGLAFINTSSVSIPSGSSSTIIQLPNGEISLEIVLQSSSSVDTLLDPRFQESTDSASISWEIVELEPALMLFDPDGILVAQGGDTLNHVATKSGSYTLAVDEGDPGNTSRFDVIGAYELSILLTPQAVDLGVSALHVLPGDDSANFVYTVNGPLPLATTVDLYWADKNLVPVGGPIHSEVAQVTTGTYSVKVAGLRVAPQGATYLFVRADPLDAVNELNENNNVSDLRVIYDPSVTVQVTPAVPSKGDPYTVKVDVKNNSLVWESFLVRSLEFFHPSQVERVDQVLGGGVYPEMTVSLAASQSKHIEIGLTKSWAWIPRENPVAQSLTTLRNEVSDAFRELSIGGPPAFPGPISGKLGSLANRLITLFDLIDDVLLKPVWRVQFDYVGIAKGNGGVVEDEQIVKVEVPAKFQFYYASYLATVNIGKLALPTAIYVSIVNPTVGIGLVALSLASYAAALISYRQAVDPPDPNFREVVAPVTPRLTAVDALPAGPLKEYATLSLRALGLRQAEATARDRTLGARGAGDAYWESEQLRAASEFAAKVAVLDAQASALQSLVSASLGEAPDGASVVAYLTSHDLPETVVGMFREQGWTEEEIGALQANLRQLDAGAFAAPNDANFERVGTILTAGSSLVELEESLRIRVGELGLEVRDLTEAELEDLLAAREEIEVGLAAGYPSDNLLGRIVAYLDEARWLAFETNNYNAVRDELDLGLGAIVDFQGLEATPAGVTAYVDRLVEDERIAEVIAGPLRDILVQAEQQLAVGDFASLTWTLYDFADAVRAGRGTSIPSGVADDLVAYASYLGGFFNRPPQLDPLVDRVVDEGVGISFVVGVFEPNTGQTLSFSLDPGAPAGAHIDPNTGVFTWTATDGTATSSSSVTVRVTDDGTPNLSVTRTFAITVINVAPTVDTGPETTLPQGGTLSRSGSFADPGLDTWTATVDYGDGSGSQPLTLNSDKTYQLSHAFSIAGSHTVTVTVTDKDGGVGSHNFTVNVTALPPIDGPPTVRSVVINDGSAQRSMIHSLTVNFSGPVTIQPGAFELRDQSGRLIGLNVATSMVGERTVAVLSFSKPGVIAGTRPDANSIRLRLGRPNIIGGSLADGNYTLTIRGDRISDGSGRLLDGDADGLAGGNRTERFFRRFGDANGDGRVDRRDVVRFRQTFGRKAGQTGFQPFFDFRGNGVIGGGDLFQLLRRRLPAIGLRL